MYTTYSWFPNPKFLETKKQNNMVQCLYSTEVLLNDPKGKTLAIVLYVSIQVNNAIVCKDPALIDVFSDASYDITIDYDVFIKSWEKKSIQDIQNKVEQLMRFYLNIEEYKSKMK